MKLPTQTDAKYKSQIEKMLLRTQRKVQRDRSVSCRHKIYLYRFIYCIRKGQTDGKADNIGI